MEDIIERLTDGKHYLLKIGAALGVVATALGGCVINTAPERGNGDSTQQASTSSKKHEDLDWETIDDDDHIHGYPEGRGGQGVVSRTCIGSTQLIKLSSVRNEPLSITAIPNSPECGYTPPTPESSPTPTAETTSTPASGN